MIKIQYEIIHKDEIDSTNNLAKILVKQGIDEGTVVVAETQTNGKGRLGRQWESPKGTSLLASVILRPKIEIECLSQLSIVTATTLCETLQDLTELDIKIKWPNDLVVNGKKVCGILLELCQDNYNQNYLILGIGLNVNTPSFPKDLPYATSLYLESGKRYTKETILQNFLKRFEIDYKTFQVTKNIAFLKKRFEKNCITLHKTVKLIREPHETIAQSVGLTDRGELIVSYPDGTIESVAYGEVSVRGLYEYT